MRVAALLAAPLLVIPALAQTSAPPAPAPPPSVTAVPYSNPATTLLQQTDANGVVTGQPQMPSAMLSQPPLATIPAGLPPGINSVAIGNGTTFLVSVGTSTTAVVTPESSTASATGTNSKGTATGTAAASSSSGAADHVKVAGGALVGAGALFAAFL